MVHYYIITVIFWWNRSCARYSSTFSFDDIRNVFKSFLLILICTRFELWTTLMCDMTGTSCSGNLILWEITLLSPFYHHHILPLYPRCWPITCLDKPALSNQQLVARTRQLPSLYLRNTWRRADGRSTRWDTINEREGRIFR